MSAGAGAKRPTTAVGDTGPKILQLDLQDRRLGKVFLDLQPAIVQQRLHRRDEQQLGDVPDAVLVARLIIAGGDRDFDRAQPFGLEQIGDRPADPGQVKDELGVAEEGRVAEQPMHMPHNAGIRRSERQALQVAAAEGRLAVGVRDALHDRGRVNCVAGVDACSTWRSCRCPCDR